MNGWMFDGRHQRPDFYRKRTPWAWVLLLALLAGAGLWSLFHW